MAELTAQQTGRPSSRSPRTPTATVVHGRGAKAYGFIDHVVSRLG
jgi:ATP-dependent protease ClpP protease subunit